MATMALSNRTLLRVLNNGSPFRALFSSPHRCVTIAPRKFEPPVQETHDARNARLHRPQSPHLTIYKFQVTSVLSISHRFTGLALSAYVTGIGVTSLAASSKFPLLLESLHGVSPSLIFAGKFLIAFPFAYHFVNGIRHLFWDYGKFLTIKGVYTTGYAMLGTATVLSIILCQL